MIKISLSLHELIRLYHYVNYDIVLQLNNDFYSHFMSWLDFTTKWTRLLSYS